MDYLSPFPRISIQAHPLDFSSVVDICSYVKRDNANQSFIGGLTAFFQLNGLVYYQSDAQLIQELQLRAFL